MDSTPRAEGSATPGGDGTRESNEDPRCFTCHDCASPVCSKAIHSPLVRPHLTARAFPSARMSRSLGNVLRESWSGAEREELPAPFALDGATVRAVSGT
ncbi:MAG: hypothetical protein JW751_30535 [Polyangiaceae bacterium]|nr:hypothetical protein [Polyangiaceae bacterium]